MNYNNSNSICDYVTVQLKDATVNNNIYTWNIPNTYYSNRRSPVAEVCLVDGSIVTDEQHGLAVVWLGSNQNQYNTQNDGALIGTLRNFRVNGAEYVYEMGKSCTIEVATAARPQTIQLKFVDVTNASVTMLVDANHGGQLVFKFKYFDPEEIGQNFIDTSYKSIL